MAVIGGFRSDLSIARILETFRRCFVFQSRVSNENGGKPIMTPLNLGTSARTFAWNSSWSPERSNDWYARIFQVHRGYINIKNSFFVLLNNILTNDRVSHVAQKDFINVSNNTSVVLSVNLQHLILPILCRECFLNNSWINTNMSLNATVCQDLQRSEQINFSLPNRDTMVNAGVNTASIWKFSYLL